MLPSVPNNVVGDVRFGSKADMCSALADGRFVPIADMRSVLDQFVMSQQWTFS